MKLWYSPASPFVRKVIAAAHECGLVGRLEIVDASSNPINRNMDLVAHNPVGKIPALVLDDGQALFDSRVICAYLDSISQGEKLIPAEGPARFRAMTLEALGDAIMDAAVLTRYEGHLRPQELRWQGWIEGQTAKVNSGLESLERDWAEFLAGPFTIGHLAVGAALGYLDYRFPDLDWRSGHPKLAQWFEGFSQRPSMKASAPKA